jgi:hypothetical protein
VIARNSPIAEGSAALWDEAFRMITKAAESADLDPAP